MQLGKGVQTKTFPLTLSTLNWHLHVSTMGSTNQIQKQEKGRIRRHLGQDVVLW